MRISGWCNGSTSDFESVGLGSNPSLETNAGWCNGNTGDSESLDLGSIPGPATKVHKTFQHARTPIS